jgi:hypothetical protein
MESISTGDKHFLDRVSQWLQTGAETLVMIRYSRAAGSKSFEFFTSMQALLGRLKRLPAQTEVTVFRTPQLPFRGVVDDEFISRTAEAIADGLEFLVIETNPRSAGSSTWFHHIAGESHADLRGALEQSRGRYVAVGAYPPWLENSSDVISAIVPDQSGNATPGAY